MEIALSKIAWVGLEDRDARLYRAALTRGGPVAPAVMAAELGLTAAETAASLDRLATLGFLAEHGAVAPAVALRSLLHRRLAELHAERAGLEAAADSVDRLAAELLAAEPGTLSGEGIEYAVGREEVGRRALDLTATVRSELLVLDAPPYAQLDAPPAPGAPALCRPFSPAAGSDVAHALQRGVQIRRVISQEGADQPGRMAAITELAELGLSVRVRPDVPVKLMVADRTTALFPPAGADPRDAAVVVHDGLLMSVLVPLFEAMWESAMPLGADGGEEDAPADPSAPPTEAERALLALLATGLKDEAIARQLDVHVHTARRRISALLARLGATTRFQAGMQAARRGWLAE